MKFEAYRIHFLLGAITAIIGIAVWLLFDLELIVYPRLSHANIMFFSCFWFFVAGFLMTALPKMTGTQLSTKTEITTLSILGLSQVFISLFLNDVKINLILFVFQNLILVIFLFRRFRKSRRLPFDGFVFVGFAFANALLAPIFILTADAIRIDFIYLFCGEAFLLNLISGLGGRLIPVISRLPNALAPHEQSQNSQIVFKFILAVILNLSFLMQAFDLFYWAVGQRLLVLGLISIIHFKIFVRPLRFSILGFGLKISLFFLFLSYSLQLFDGLTYNVPAQHLLYIGGFLLMTLMIASRVMLAHGEKSLDYELKSSRLLIIILFIAVVAVFRYLSDLGSIGMATAALLAVIAIGMWSYKFVRITFFSK